MSHLPSNLLDGHGELRAGVVTAVLTVVLGGPVGLVWAATRPSVNAAVIALEESANDVQIDVDIRFLLLGLLTGAGAGLLAWIGARRHGLGVVLGLAAGGLAAAAIAAPVGRLAAHPDEVSARAAGQFAAAHLIAFDTVEPAFKADLIDRATFRLRSPVMTLGLPVGAAASFGLLTWAFDRTSRQRRP